MSEKIKFTFANEEAKYMFAVMLIDAHNKGCSLGGRCMPVEQSEEQVGENE